MTSRERVIAAIEFSGPDRIPHNNAFVPAVSLPGFGGQVVVHPLCRGTATLCPYSSSGSGRLRELRHGSLEDARRHGSFDGGFISCCELHPDLPWENMVAILEAFHEYGRYPLRLAWAGDHAVEI